MKTRKYRLWVAVVQGVSEGASIASSESYTDYVSISDIILHFVFSVGDSRYMRIRKC